MSSDSAISTLSSWQSTAGLIGQLPSEDVEQFRSTAYTIGGMMVFPRNKVEGQWTMSMARGMDQSIAGRLHLTLECIRRHYQAPEAVTPLSATLARYARFFTLFATYTRYRAASVEFVMARNKRIST